MDKLNSEICYHDDSKIVIRGYSLTNDLMGAMSYTEMLLLHLLGRKPEPMQVKILDSVLVGVMEHGITPSVVAARQTLLGAPESFQGAVASGLLGVGDHFAGTCSKCAAFFDEVVKRGDSVEQGARELVAEYRETKQKIPGYGHPSFVGVDPRTTMLFKIAREAGAKGTYIDAVEKVAAAIKEVLGKDLIANVSAAIGAVLLEAGIPVNATRGIVLVSRCGGLVGHIAEEQKNPMGHEMWQVLDKGTKYTGPGDV